MTPIPKIAGEVHRLASDLPDELILDLANSLIEYSGTDPRDLKTKILSGVTPPAVRQRVDKFFKYWQANVPEISAESVALALLTAAQVEGHYRNYQQLELVWTGPDSEFIPLRRTDQALLQLIDEANKTLHIVSFAVYKVGRISKALVQAASRGVSSNRIEKSP